MKVRKSPLPCLLKQPPLLQLILSMSRTSFRGTLAVVTSRLFMSILSRHTRFLGTKITTIPSIWLHKGE